MAEALQKIPTGNNSFDQLLRGGYARGELTLIYGEAATGKTTAVMQASVRAAAAGLKSIYVDSDRSFTQQRFHQLAGEDADKISQLIMLFFPETFSEQRDIVESLQNYVTPTLGLIIVDSVSSLYRAAFSKSESVFSLNRDLGRQVAYLTELSASRKIACILTSQVHARLSEPSGDIEPVARRTLFHFPRTIIRLRNTLRAGVKECILERINGSEVDKASCLLSLTETGLSDLVA